jgi:hypothetical protein
VSISDKRVGARKPVIQQADINAAINIGLRAVAQSERFEVFPRLRTKTDTNGRRRLEVPRIWGAKGPVFQLSGESEQSEKINPRANLFLDLAGVAHWGKATFSEVESLKGHNFVLQAALFSAVRKKEWERVMELNELRCAEWGNRRSK